MKNFRKMLLWFGLPAVLLGTLLAVSCAEDDEETPPPPAATLQLTGPNGGEAWGVGIIDTIRWTASNLTGNVKVQVNYDYPNAQSPWTDIVASVPVTPSSYLWTVPNQATTTARMRVTSLAQTTVGDTSNANFTITRCSYICRQAMPIQVATAVTGCGFTATPPDSDQYFAITLTQGDYRFRLTGFTPPATDYDLYVYQTCTDVTQLHQFWNVGEEDTTVTMNGGSYVLGVHLDHGVGTYELLVTVVPGPALVDPGVPAQPVIDPNKRAAKAPGVK